MLSSLLLSAAAAAAPPVILVDRDDVVIRESCTVRIIDAPIADRQGDGVVRIEGDDIVVDFGGATLRGAAPDVPLSALTGIGVTVTGRNVVVRNLVLDGFKVGLLAQAVPGGVFEQIEVRRNYAQRLASTPAAEDAADWLFPHRNDADEWRLQHGAGLCIERSRGVTIRRVTVRRSQNGIILSRVEDSQLYDNDCSFLSGWGLAMWRSSRNAVTRNAFDFCVRGYSHGVYNRGQDSAGILLFEQCDENIFAENSATHGGDGVFGFAGLEALGQAPPPGEHAADAAPFHQGRGCNGNVFLGNDLSYAAAHGLEMTFSFDNQIVGNRFAGNAICGIWGGYSQRTLIAANRFVGNGEGAYGLERGGVNIEHSVENRLLRNIFQRNAVGIRLWWDDDAALLATPWAAANDTACRDNVIAANSFERDAIAVELLLTDRTLIVDNRFVEVGARIVADERSGATLLEEGAAQSGPMPAVAIVGESRPVGARSRLAGRDRIIMTEWGPYDWQSPLLQRVGSAGTLERWRVLGERKLVDVVLTPQRSGGADGGAPVPDADDQRVHVDAAAGTFDVFASRLDALERYRVTALLDDGSTLSGEGAFVDATWQVRLFAWTIDPRDDVEGWRAEAERGVDVQVGRLSLDFGGGGPAEALRVGGAAAPKGMTPELRAALAGLPRDRFGTIATTTLHFEPGTYELEVTSDDGVRVWIDDRLVIDDWTWHAPRTERVEVAFDRPTAASLRVEHFELDGHAVLRVDLR
ncbi:MAG TPA: right-handed parallel beta-helix repeat-containing protein [Phycisphaerales bacterium]|nr:right-handed parallel beta-helix repeat-containing protein [Phycisphaerales bacterium]HMP36571.1 right-handed parallel beta-helix repeat-containing protein [Phycisphaerales bacterium]